LFFRYDVVNINLEEKPEWYFLKNPLGKVPALETESGDCIYESLIIADYLDEKYPQTPLHSTDSMQKAKDRIMIERFASVCIYFMLTLVIQCILQSLVIMFYKRSISTGYRILYNLCSSIILCSFSSHKGQISVKKKAECIKIIQFCVHETSLCTT
jgi:hypothetical protein